MSRLLIQSVAQPSNPPALARHSASSSSRDLALRIGRSSGKLLARLLSTSFIALVAAGCAALQPPSKPAEQPTPPVVAPTPAAYPKLIRLLSYYHDISYQPKTAIEREWQFYQAALINDQCDAARMRLGLVLLRAIELELTLQPDDNLLQACVHSPDQDSGIPQFAQLIQSQLLRHSSLQAQQQEDARTIESLKKENQELRRQVDGLKAIERSLQDRRHLE